ncbi:MAG: CRTAC1 family protein, partial [Verrucomicrobiota bacterium]
PGNRNTPRTSVFDVVLHVENPVDRIRMIIEGRLHVTWPLDEPDSGLPRPQTLAARSTRLVSLKNGDGFEPLMHIGPEAESGMDQMVEPVLVNDLNRDGLLDIVLGGRNLLMQNLGKGRFRRSQVHPNLPQLSSAAVLGDFNGDGFTDFLCIIRRGEMLLFPGNAEGRFKAEPVTAFDTRIENPTVITAGDIDGDRDLDVYVGQYKPPYRGGQMPVPYYDANDGLPAYLLVNRGNGTFVDATVQAGLEAKRHRRTYGASFIDLTRDGQLDLMVTSDFAGTDVYQGDGKGRFTDITETWLPPHRTFGMSHSFGDYNQDARMDIFVTGMSSTTARRLDTMGLKQKDRPDSNIMRTEMGYGNRVFLGTRKERFSEAGFNDSVARSGWSWGVTSFDVDNDADLDLYIANGHLSGKSRQDYCTRFWCHDIYTDSTYSSDELQKVFGEELAPLFNREISWNGYEHNVLYHNRGKGGFRNTAFLFGAALEFDARGVISADIDHDGRMDLIVVENQLTDHGRMHQSMHLLLNRLDLKTSWVGLRLHENPGRPSPLNATVVLKTTDRQQSRVFTTGDSLYSQHPTTAHFGLGTQKDIEWIEVQYADGTKKRIEKPHAEKYHNL